MKIDNALVDHLARLSKLEFEESETERIKKDLQGIVDLVEQLEEVDVTGVEPLIYMSDEVNVLREDVVGPMLTEEEALKNAPHHDDHYFKVPKVIKK